MNTEEKAKRYDDALEITKTLYCADDVNCMDLETIFPELKESEDEKVEKAIFGMVYDSDNDLWSSYDVSKSNVLAWLEKQGEPFEINPTEFDTRLQALIGKFETLPKEELVGSLSFWLNVVQNDGTYKADEKQGEQKPAWSEDDEEILRTIISDGLRGAEFDMLQINWLKSLKQRIG